MASLPPTSDGGGITARAFALGTFGALAIGTGVSYTDTIVRGARIAQDFGSPVAVFLLVLVAAGLNPLLGLLRRSWQLSSAEVALIYIMALLGAAVPSMGFTSFFVPYLSGAQYYATPENGWAELFVHHVPTWLIPHDPAAIKAFYEGSPTAQVDWDAWLPPLLAWAPFMLALYLVMISLMVIMRRQWMDHERLLYPLMQPSLAMIEQDERRLPPLLRSWLFWLGWGIPFAIGLVNGLHAYYPFIPKIELAARILLFRETTPITPTLSFTTLGLTYFLSQDVALGIWFFNLVAKLQQGAFNVLGVTSDERMEWVTVPILAHQNIGAMLVLVLFGLWIGRRHLRAVLRKAFVGDPTVDDGDEMMSYRACVFIVLGGGAFMLWWLVQTGLPLWAAALTLFMAFVIFQGLTLMVTQGGFFIARTPMNPGHFVVSGFGVESLGGKGVTALGYTWSWAGEMRIFVMAACANSLHLAQRCLRGSRRALLWAMLVAISVSIVGSVWTQLSLGYEYGAINMGGFYTGLVKYPSNFISRHLTSQTEWNAGGWVWTGFGASLMWALMVVKQRFVWWPIHPMSLPISAMWMTDRIAWCVFVSWLLKLVILKYGGPRLFRQGKPLFIGFVAGHFTSMCSWTVIDAFTGMEGNFVFFL